MLKDVIAHTNNTPRPYFESPLFWKCQICVFWRFLRFFRNFHKFEARVHVSKVLVEIFGGFVTSNDALNVSRPIFYRTQNFGPAEFFEVLVYRILRF